MSIRGRRRTSSSAQYPEVTLETERIDSDPESDIYRGPPPAGPSSIHSRGRSRSSSTSSSSSSSSSSSASSAGPLGAIAGVVERAIARWARANGSSSSLSSASSSSSDASTLRTLTTKPVRPRRRPRRQSSIASSRNALSEAEVHARLQAREASRRVPRSFTLYVPPTLRSGPVATPSAGTESPQQEVDGVHTAKTITPVLYTLEAAMKKAARVKRHHNRDMQASRPHLNGFTSSMDAPLTAPPLLRKSRTSAPMNENVPLKPGKYKGKGKDVSQGPLHYAANMASHHRARLDPPALKNHASTPLATPPIAATPALPPISSEPAWWLDVASPTWEDMRTIGKLLHLHPLTLEDILQQETREKLEQFPRLGYYFVVFRAIETIKARERVKGIVNLGQGVGPSSASWEQEEDEGIVDEAMVYLVVFPGGFCSFHFSDITEHTDRLRNRALAFEKTRVMSSDWLAHGLVDSVVDAFFPFLTAIEKEVLAIDDIAFSDHASESKPAAAAPALQDRIPIKSEEKPLEEMELHTPVDIFAEKIAFGSPPFTKPVTRPRIAFAFPPPRLFLRRTRRHLISLFNHFSKVMFPWRLAAGPMREGLGTSAGRTLRRMARTRRLVTVLSRLLASKSDVVARVQKRLLQTAVDAAGAAVPPAVINVPTVAQLNAEGLDGGMPATNPAPAPLLAEASRSGSASRVGESENDQGNGFGNDQGTSAEPRSEAMDVALYYGDVQDHILTLYQSFAHLERMLSQSHPTYCSQLRVQQRQANSRMDKTIMLLSCVTVGVYFITPTVGIFSMNCQVPRSDGLWMFGVVIAMTVVELIVFYNLIRWWWAKSKRKQWI